MRTTYNVGITIVLFVILVAVCAASCTGCSKSGRKLHAQALKRDSVTLSKEDTVISIEPNALEIQAAINNMATTYPNTFHQYVDSIDGIGIQQTAVQIADLSWYILDERGEQRVETQEDRIMKQVVEVLKTHELIYSVHKDKKVWTISWGSELLVLPTIY
jgi:hypothetical protein